MRALRFVLALTALLASSAALAQFACLSNATGNWNAAGTWTACGGGVPGNDDTANVRNGHTVSISSTPITVLAVTVSNGTLQFAGGAKVLNINGNLSIAATEVLNVNGGSNSTHTVNITGNITNAGSLTCGTGNDLCNFVFNGGGTQTLSGAGTTQFNNITIAAGTIVNSTNNITVIGTTTVTGTLGITNTAGTKVFTGAVTIAGTWDNSTNEDIAMGGSLTNNGTFTSGTGTYTFQTTAAQSWAGTSGLTFGGNLVVSATRTNNTTTQIDGNLSGAAALTNAAGQTLRIGGNATLTTLTATALNNTVEYNGAGAQTPKLTNYANLTISSAGAVAFNGSFSVAGNLTDNGNFSHTGAANIVTFNGAAAQSLLGTAADTTFQNVTMANTAAAATRTLTLNHDMTAVTNLTFSAVAGSGGRIVTGASKVVIEATAGTITSACPTDTNDFIAGNLQRFVAAPGPTTVDFPVGSDAAVACSRVSLIFTGVGVGGGRLIVGATAGDHPQIAGSGLDAANSVNRYWTVTTTGVTGTAVTFTSYSATFNFLAGDIDAGATPAAFIATRYDGTAWNPTNEGVAAATSLSVLAETGIGQFAIGETAGFNVNLGSAGRFDAYDQPPLTNAGSVRGNIRTKLAGTAFTLTIVHLNLAGTALAALAANVTIDLVDASPAGGVFTNNCSSLWTTVIATSGSVAFGGGNNRTWTFTVNNAYPNVRVKVTAAGEIGCSGDRFAIRPADLFLEAIDSGWQTPLSGTASDRFLHNIGAAGGNVHAASTAAAATPRPFTLRATARNSAAATTTLYAGATTIRSGPTCVLPAGCATGTLNIAGTAVASGVTTATANYSEAGTFTLEFEDSTFANVDAADTALSVRRVPQSGGAREIGRFVPDRFTFTGASTPQFRTYDAVCVGARSFTYIGQPFRYAAAALPTATVQAVNAAGAVTTNYRGTLFKLAGSGIGETYSPNAVGPALDPALIGTPTLGGVANGSATYTAAAAGSLAYTRSTTTPIPAANNPFDANISLSVTATDTSEAAVTDNGNITTPTPLVFNGGGTGIPFDSGSAFRYGRVRLLNAVGSDKLDLPIPIYAEHWAGTAFVTNTADNCSNFLPGNFALSNYQGGINAGNVGGANISVGGAFSAGVGSLTLLKPTAAVTAPGSVDICLDLGPDTAPPADTCTATTPAARSYLQGRNAGTDYDDDPRGRAAFGVFGSQPNNFIYFRENF